MVRPLKTSIATAKNGMNRSTVLDGTRCQPKSWDDCRITRRALSDEDDHTSRERADWRGHWVICLLAMVILPLLVACFPTFFPLLS
jgi:hypothetical protein